MRISRHDGDTRPELLWRNWYQRDTKRWSRLVLGECRRNGNEFYLSIMHDTVYTSIRHGYAHMEFIPNIRWSMEWGSELVHNIYGSYLHSHLDGQSRCIGCALIPWGRATRYMGT